MGLVVTPTKKKDKKDKKKGEKKVKKTEKEEKEIAEAKRQMRIREAQKTARRWRIEETDGHRKAPDERPYDSLTMGPKRGSARTFEEVRTKWSRRSRKGI